MTHKLAVHSARRADVISNRVIDVVLQPALLHAPRSTRSTNSQPHSSSLRKHRRTAKLRQKTWGLASIRALFYSPVQLWRLLPCVLVVVGLDAEEASSSRCNAKGVRPSCLPPGSTNNCFCCYPSVSTSLDKQGHPTCYAHHLA